MTHSRKHVRVLSLALALLAVNAPSWAAPAPKLSALPPLASFLPGPPAPLPTASVTAAPRMAPRQTVVYTVELTRLTAAPALQPPRAEVALPDKMSYQLSALTEEEAHLTLTRQFALPCGDTPVASASTEFCNISGGLRLTVKPVVLGEGGKLKATLVAVSLREPAGATPSAGPSASAAAVMRVVETRQVLPFTPNKPYTLPLGDYEVTITAQMAK